MEVNHTSTDIVDAARSTLEARGDVAFAYLFGSHARGTERPESDVDLAVHFGEGGRSAFGSRRNDDASARIQRARQALELEAELERSLGRRVQVVVLEDAPPGLVQNALASGRLVYCTDDRARRLHFVDHARRYLDLESSRRIFDRYRKRRIEQGAFGGGERDRS